MAIVKMNEITIVALKNERDNLMKFITRSGMIDISDMRDLLNDNSDKLSPVLNGEQVSVLDRKLSELKSIIDFSRKYAIHKTRPFSPRRDVNESDYAAVADREKELFKLIDLRQELNDRLSQNTALINKTSDTILSLKPWINLDLPLELSETGTTSILFGSTLITKDNQDNAEKKFYDIVPQGYILKASETEKRQYYYIVYHKSNEEEINQFVADVGLSRVIFKELSGTPAQNERSLSKQLSAAEQEKSDISAALRNIAESQYDFELLYDYLTVEKEKQIALSSMIETDTTMIFRGWLPEAKVDGFCKAVSDKFTCITYVRKPDKNEDYPIKLKNNKFVSAFEMITDMYSLPRAYEVDPNPLMSVFYFIAFGIMLGDAGYGLLMMLLSGLVLKVFKPEGGSKKFMSFLFWCGVSSVIFGAAFGSWFSLSDLIQENTGFVTPSLLIPLYEPITFLICAFALGAIQLFTGMGIKAYMLFKNGKGKDAIFDIFSWYFIILGLVLMLAGGMLAPVLSKIGTVLAIIGALTVILFKARDKKNPLMRLGSGILGLYDITSYFSDIMSYSRLLALCLSSGVIGMVVNQLGSLGGLNKITGIIIFILIFAVGHLFNLALSGLGAYVHTSRLQYIEYFGKFYEGGGKPYSPLSYKTKYTKINSEEEL